MRKAALILLLVSILIVGSLAVTAQEEQKALELPILAVVKSVDKSVIKPGDEIRIIIKIINLGNATAYNVTLEDVGFPEWVGEVNGTTKAWWPMIKPNETVYHAYTVKITSVTVSKVTLSPAKVKYYDAEGNEYEALSNTVDLVADIEIRPAIDWDSLWMRATIIGASIISVILLALVVLEVKVYREYLAERKAR